MKRPRDPEKRAIEREQAEWGEFEVAITHEEHGSLGTLDETFDNDADAHYAAADAREGVADVGITTEIRKVTDDSTTPRKENPVHDPLEP